MAGKPVVAGEPDGWSARWLESRMLESSLWLESWLPGELVVAGKPDAGELGDRKVAWLESRMLKSLVAGKPVVAGEPDGWRAGWLESRMDGEPDAGELVVAGKPDARELGGWKLDAGEIDG